MRIFLWLAVAACTGLYICARVADPDLWWHIVIGRWILAHQAVPHQDYWNMFAVGQPWRAYSWSVEVVLALTDQWFGATGLAALQILLAVVLAGVLFLTSGVIARDRFMGALIGIYATVGCFNNYTLRPQVIVWILFAGALAVSDSIVERGSSRKRLLLLFVIGCLWANTHLTAALGLAAVFLWSIQSAVPHAEWRRALVASAVFFAGTLITPYYGAEWLTFLAKGGHPLKYQLISEFQPATILQYSTVFVVLQVVFLVLVSFLSRYVPSLARCALAGGMVMAGLTAVKFLPFAIITLGALIALWWRDGVARNPNGERDNLARGLLQLRDKFNSLAPATHGAAAFLLVSIAVVQVRDLLRVPLNNSIVPKAAVDFIEQRRLEHPILNEFGAGGYLMYRFSDEDGTPRYQVSIDGRTNVNPPEIWELFAASFQGRSTWRKYIEAVKPRTIMWRQGSPMVSLLFESREWCRVFASGEEDGDIVVFIRREDFFSRSGELSSTNCSTSSET